MRPRSSSRRLVSPLIASGAIAAAIASGTGLYGCYATDKGPEPPPSSLYFPTGIAVSPGGTALFLTNSDFDLQYTGGTVQAVDLARLRKMLPRPAENADCAAYGLTNASLQERALRPGPRGRPRDSATNRCRCLAHMRRQDGQHRGVLGRWKRLSAR